MTTRIVTDANGRKHITNEPLLHPPQRTWNELTLQEVIDAYNQHVKYQPEDMGTSGLVNFAAEIERILKEKNNA